MWKLDWKRAKKLWMYCGMVRKFLSLAKDLNIFFFKFN